MKILFIGCVEFSKKALEKLIELNADIAAVITRKESSQNSDFVDLTEICIKNKLKYKVIKDLNTEEAAEWIKGIAPDIAFCFGWSSLIKKEVLEIPKMGFIGFHPAALPENRGRHPIIWPLALGLEKSASTFFFMDEGADSGDILAQDFFEIKYEDYAGTLYEKICAIALNQIKDFLPRLQNNTYSRIKQDHSKANTLRKRNKSDGKIDFRMSSNAIYNLVRALARPYVGAHVEFSGCECKVWKVKEINFNKKNIEPGKVLDVKDNRITVKTYDGAIEIIEHDFKKNPEAGQYL